jgi:AraC family transcriptional regulator
MNYYERTQKAIDYIEKNIEDEIALESVAKEAVMSLSNFYRLFFSIVGYTVKEYIRLRRISLSVVDLKNNMKINDISAKYSYTSSDSFSRAFKKVTGTLPSEFRDQNKDYLFERIDVIEKYFDNQDQELLRKYPDIKVLKILKPFFVASYTANSCTPENDAFVVLREWTTNSGLLNGNINYRIFGFDVPNSLQADGSYGYEVWITIPDDKMIHDENIIKKKFNGGLYAVTSTTIGTIVFTWDRFREWLKLCRYEMGNHQCLEEHLPFEDWDTFESQEEIKIDLYMPLQEKQEKTYRS